MRSTNRALLDSFALFLILVCLVLATGCQGKPKRYELRGQVTAKDVATKTLTIKHGDIPGLMSAMTMEYPVNDASVLQQVRTGDTITAVIVTASDGMSYSLDDVRVVNQGGK